MSTFEIVRISSDFIEFLIPITILITAITNLIPKNGKAPKQLQIIKYIVVLLFGLIHGLGFSNYLKSLLGNESEIILPLFAFNIGIEIGQICIVSVILILSKLLTSTKKINQQKLNWFLSSVGAFISVFLIFK